MLYLITGLAIVHHPGQPRRRDSAGRSVCLRRRVELRVQHDVDGRAAIQESQTARVRRAVQYSLGQCSSADRIERSYSSSCLLSALANLVTKPIATVSGLCFTARLSGDLRRHRELSHDNVAAKSTSTRSNSTARRCKHITADSLGLEKAVSQTGGHPLAAQPVHAGKGARRYRSANHRRRGDDRQSGTARRLRRRRRTRSRYLRSPTDDRRGRSRRDAWAKTSSR